MTPGDSGRPGDVFLRATKGTDVTLAVDALDECNDAHETLRAATNLSRLYIVLQMHSPTKEEIIANKN